jgi:hypothetical protein
VEVSPAISKKQLPQAEPVVPFFPYADVKNAKNNAALYAFLSL